MRYATKKPIKPIREMRKIDKTHHAESIGFRSSGGWMSLTTERRKQVTDLLRNGTSSSRLAEIIAGDINWRVGGKPFKFYPHEKQVKGTDGILARKHEQYGTSVRCMTDNSPISFSSSIRKGGKRDGITVESEIAALSGFSYYIIVDIRHSTQWNSFAQWYFYLFDNRTLMEAVDTYGAGIPSSVFSGFIEESCYTRV